MTRLLCAEKWFQKMAVSVSAQVVKIQDVELRAPEKGRRANYLAFCVKGGCGKRGVLLFWGGLCLHQFLSGRRSKRGPGRGVVTRGLDKDGTEFLLEIFGLEKKIPPQK